MKIGGTRVKDIVYGVSLQVNMLLGIDFLQKMRYNVTGVEVPIRAGAPGVAMQFMFKVNTPSALAISLHHVGVPSLSVGVGDLVILSPDIVPCTN